VNYSQSKSPFGIILVLALLSGAMALPVQAADSVAIAGRLKLSGEYGLDRQSVEDGPSLSARLMLDGRQAAWQIHTWVEGGWDGTVDEQQQDQTTIKRFDKVYQANTPYLDFKEFYVDQELTGIDCRIGVQRFAWGRLDEYPINDLFNPWDYRQFIVKPMEERKIGVPAVAIGTSRQDWTYQLVWVPWFVPYRLPEPGNRWSMTPTITAGPDSRAMEVQPREPDLPTRTVENSSIGFRIQQLGEIEWAFNLFHGFDPRPVFKTTALTVAESRTGLVIDPGYVPSFQRITAVGLDAATVLGSFSLRTEAAYTINRAFNVRQEFWGYPAVPALGTTSLNSIVIESATLDYGIAADYQPLEDILLTIQAQQTLILDRPDSLFERAIETLLWANLKTDWLNQKIETSLNLAYNPEHGANMTKAGISYVFTDSWKADINALLLHGPPQSIFGRYAMNDQIGLEVIYQW